MVAHVTRDSDTTFKVKRSRSPGCFTHRGVSASGSGDRGNVLSVETYCYVAVGSAARGSSAPTEGGEGRGILWRLPRSLFQPAAFYCTRSCPSRARRGTYRLSSTIMAAGTPDVQLLQPQIDHQAQRSTTTMMLMMMMKFCRSDRVTS